MPGEWKEVVLGDLLAESTETHVTEPSDYPLLTVRLNGAGVEPAGKHPNKTLGGRPHYVRHPGQVLIGRQNFHRGSAGVVPALDAEHVTSNAISAFDTRPGHDARFVLHLLQWPETGRQAASRAVGTGQQEISQSALVALPLRIPDLPEQRRIADLLAAADDALAAQAALVEARRTAREALLSSLLGAQNGNDTTLGSVLTRHVDKAPVAGDSIYKQVTLGVRGAGARLRCETRGALLGSAVFRVRAGDLIYSKIDARHGAFAVLPSHLDGAYVTGDFPSFSIKSEIALPEYLSLITSSPNFWKRAADQAVGTTNRVRLNPDRLLAMSVRLPGLPEQRRIVDLLASSDTALRTDEAALAVMRSAREQLLHDLLSGTHRIPDSYDELLGQAP